MRLAWATDIHLDFITNPQSPVASSNNLDVFCNLLKREDPDALIISGDISLAAFLKDHLLALESRIQRPIFFVLGNHDFWGGSFDSVRKNVTSFSNSSDYLKYLSTSSYTMLTQDVALVGHDGWYDGFYGDPRMSAAAMNDWELISDLLKARTSFGLEGVLLASRQQALLAANHVADSIKKAILKKPKKIIVVTHVPPFTDPLDKSALDKNDLYPWYSSKTMGDMLLTAAKNNPQIDFEVFCGHVHEECNKAILKNLFLHVGGAEYSSPRTQGTFNISL